MSRLWPSKSGLLKGISPWRAASVVLAAVLAAMLVGFWRTGISLITVWAHTGTFQYAFFIFPLSAWTAYGLRDTLQADPPQPSILGLPLIAALGFIWFTGHQVDINLPQHFALVAMFPAVVLAVWGWRAVRVLAFPLGYLVFAIPWGDSLVGPLQTFTAHFAVRALELIGTPVLLNGHEIITPTAVWMVADACSGIKFFIACIALGCLYAYLMYRYWWKRVLFVGLAAVVPIIANGLRVFFTVLIGDTWGLKYATGTDHLIFGWQFFGTVLFALLLAGWFLRDPLTTPKWIPQRRGSLTSTYAVIWLAAMVLVLAAPAFGAWVGRAPIVTTGTTLTAPSIAGWFGPYTARTHWRPRYIGANAAMRAAYRDKAAVLTVDVFGARYIGGSGPGHDLITYGNDVYDPATTTVLNTATRRVKLTANRSLRVRELRLSTASGTRLIWYWYCIDGRCTDSPIWVKLLQGLDALEGKVSRASVWAVSSAGSTGETKALRAGLASFVRAAPAITGRRSGARRVLSAGAAGHP